MPKLCQIVALVAGKKTQVEKEYGELNKTLQKAEQFYGLNKQYRPIDEADKEKLPPETKKIVRRVTDVISEARVKLVEIFDLIATQECGNCETNVDVTVDGQIILTEVPVTVLLYLEKQLNDLNTFVGNIPVLDVSQQWTLDAATGNYVTAPVETHRTKKVSKVVVLYPATPEHPAQTQLLPEDVIAGYWTGVNSSSAMPLTEKKAILERISKLIDAVKSARELANSVEVTPQRIGNNVLSYVFGK